MNKAIRICFIVFTIVYFVLFAMFVLFGILPLALSKQLIEELMKSDPKFTEEMGVAFVTSLAVSMFITASVFLFAACTCTCSLKKYPRAKTFANKLIIGIFNIVIGSLPSGVLIIIQAAREKHNPQVVEVKEEK